MNNHTLNHLQSQRGSIIKRMTNIDDFRPSKLYHKCDKPSHHCAKAASPDHGPYWTVSRIRPSQHSVSHAVPDEAVETIRERIAKYQHFTQLLAELIEISCNYAVGAHLKQSSMHWTVDGANASVALRCCVPSDDFWHRGAVGQ